MIAGTTTGGMSTFNIARSTGGPEMFPQPSKPRGYGVTYLPTEVMEALREKHGEYWMDHDPERYFQTLSFDTVQHAKEFARKLQGESLEGNPFVTVFRRTNFQCYSLGHGISDWSWDEEEIELE